MVSFLELHVLTPSFWPKNCLTTCHRLFLISVLCMLNAVFYFPMHPTIPSAIEIAKRLFMVVMGEMGVKDWKYYKITLHVDLNLRFSCLVFCKHC